MNEEFDNDGQTTTKPLVRTVTNLKSTTTNIRGFADSMDHLLNAFEEFFPLIEKVAKTTENVTQTLTQGNTRRSRSYRRYHR